MAENSRESVRKDVPNSRTVRHHVAELERDRIYSMYEDANEAILDAAQDEGRLDHEVDVAIDYTNIMYYGDKNGTSHAYQYATLKIVSGGEHYTLLALPVAKFDSDKRVVQELLDYAEEKVNVRRFYLDRSFFSGEIINLLDERNTR